MVEISGDTLAFLRENVRSAWAVEQLVLMRRHAERAWTIDDLVRELRSSNTLVTANLTAFERAGVTRQDDDGYRFAPVSDALENICAQIEEAYRERPVSLINAVRADRLRDFADAFRLRKDPK